MYWWLSLDLYLIEFWEPKHLYFMKQIGWSCFSVKVEWLFEHREVSQTMLWFCWLVIGLGSNNDTITTTAFDMIIQNSFLSNYFFLDVFCLFVQPKKGNKNLFFLLVWTLLTAKSQRDLNASKQKKRVRVDVTFLCMPSLDKKT